MEWLRIRKWNCWTQREKKQWQHCQTCTTVGTRRHQHKTAQPRNTWKRDSNNYSWKMMEAAVKDEAKWKTVVHGVYPKAL